MAVCVSLPPTPRFRSCPGGRWPGLPPEDWSAPSSCWLAAGGSAARSSAATIARRAPGSKPTSDRPSTRWRGGFARWRRAVADPALVRAAADDDTSAAHQLLTRAAEIVATRLPGRRRADGVWRRRHTGRLGGPAIRAARRSSPGRRSLVPHTRCAGLAPRLRAAGDEQRHARRHDCRRATIAVGCDRHPARAACRAPTTTRIECRRRSRRSRSSCRSRAHHPRAMARPSTCRRRQESDC